MAGGVLGSRPKPVRAARADERLRTAQHYWAFLSYSHKDTDDADWLHESLESYRVPPALVGKLTDMGPVPKRLTPIFRDRHELAASGDLSDDIEEALAGSRFLIVLCSPSAATSRWTNSEIDQFKRRHPESCILAAILAGEPFASTMPGREEEECFPEALRIHYDRRGRPTEHRAEPIAADLREGRDGRRLGLLKIVAGMLGVGLDDLVQRETHRRHKRHRWITAASVAGMLVTSGLAYTAIEARDEARDQRREAEGLIGFMLGDLRQRLEPVGRLDVLDAVGARALAFYEKQDKASLSDEALSQRSAALTLMGKIATSRGDLDGALRRHKEALSGTAEALRRFPDDPQRIWDHAQSVYYVGEIARLRGQVSEAAAQYREYRRLAEQMIAADPTNPKWQLEGVYSATNLGMVQSDLRRHADAAAAFQASVAETEKLVATDPANMEYQRLLLEALAYLSDALDNAGRLDAAVAQRKRQLAILAPFLARARPDATLQQKAMIAHMALSRLRFQRGEVEPGLSHASDAVALGKKLIELEPTNADWLGRGANTQLNMAILLLRADRSADATAAAGRGCGMIDRLIARDATVVSWREASRRCIAIRAELAARQGAAEEAWALAREMLGSVEADQVGATVTDPFRVALAHKLAGDIFWRTGDRAGAIAAWRTGLAAWPKAMTETPNQLAQRGEMLRGIGQRTEGARIASQLTAMGYRLSISNRARI